MEYVSFLKVSEWNLKVNKLLCRKSDQLGGISSQRRIIHYTLLDKTSNLLHSVTIIDAAGSAKLSQCADIAHLAFEYLQGYAPAQSCHLSLHCYLL